MTDLFIVFLAKYLVWALVAFAVLIFFKSRRIIKEIFFSAFLARFGFTELIRFFYDRPRPFEVENITPLILREGGGSSEALRCISCGDSLWSL